jgi:succinyl-CoA synthetase alpha subunit
MIRRYLLRSCPGSGPIPGKHISFSTSTRQNSYEDTVSNLKIGKHTRVIFQGFTGKPLSSPLLSAVNSGVRKTSVFITRTF